MEGAPMAAEERVRCQAVKGTTKKDNTRQPRVPNMRGSRRVPSRHPLAISVHVRSCCADKVTD